MHKTSHSNNPNGKLFIEHFNDVRRFDDDVHYLGAEHEHYLNNHLLGVATISALVVFKFKQIRDVLSFTIYGKPSHYLAAMLKQYYLPKNASDDVKKAFEEETVFVHIVWHWKQRNLAVQEPLIQDWWRNIQENNKIENAYQTSLAL